MHANRVAQTSSGIQAELGKLQELLKEDDGSRVSSGKKQASPVKEEYKKKPEVAEQEAQTEQNELIDIVVPCILWKKK